jgi:hypothetical protein
LNERLAQAEERLSRLEITRGRGASGRVWPGTAWHRDPAHGRLAGLGRPLAQLLKVALDPRWQFTIGQSFVQQASGLNVAPLNTAGS